MNCKPHLACILAALFALPGLAACGSDDSKPASPCEALCNKQAACTNPAETLAECKTSCEKDLADSQTMNCRTQTEAAIACAETKDVCKGETTGCEQQAVALVACVMTYCMANPQAAICSGDAP